MKEMTLKEIQEVSLQIMKHIHEFCVKNEIQYSLAYGTLLGAVRHKGFIPWDDDIDIIMSRENYDRFIQLYKDSQEYKLFVPERRNSYVTYARLCDMSKTYVHTWAPMAAEEFGVWVDIFPMDKVDENVERGIEKNRELIKLNHKMFRRRTTIASLGQYGWWKIPQRIIKKMIVREDIHKIVDDYIRCSKKHETSDSNHVGVLLVSVWNTDKNEYFPKEIMESLIEVPFEDTTFYAVKDFDNYLRVIYGDYMQLPPIEKRIGHRVHKYYWKNK